MTVYRITVLSFPPSALIHDRFVPLNVTRSLFPKSGPTSSLALMKAPEIWDRAGSPLCYFILFFSLSLLLFFLLHLCSGVDSIRTWPLWDKVHEPRGSVGNILNTALKRNMSKECQTLSISDKCFLFAFFHKISLFSCLRQIWPYTRQIQCAVMCVRPDCHFSLFSLVIKADELIFFCSIKWLHTFLHHFSFSLW